jgi:tetratricopeptide (TPR) repeat protein
MKRDFFFLFFAAIAPFSVYRSAAQSPSLSVAAPSHDSFVVSVGELATPPKAARAFDKGTTLLKNGDPQASVAYFQAVIELAPRNYAPYHNLALAHYYLGHFDEAALNFEKSIDLTKGSFAPSFFGLSMVLYRRGEYSRAESLIQQGLLVAPWSAPGKYCLGLVQYSLGDTTDAQRNAFDALRLDPRLTDAHLLLAHIHERLHAPSAVLADVQTYLALSPDGNLRFDALALRARAHKELLDSSASNW